MLEMTVKLSFHYNVLLKKERKLEKNLKKRRVLPNVMEEKMGFCHKNVHEFS
jgi:hypothetical protein